MRSRTVSYWASRLSKVGALAGGMSTSVHIALASAVGRDRPRRGFRRQSGVVQARRALLAHLAPHLLDARLRKESPMPPRVTMLELVTAVAENAKSEQEVL